MDVKILWKRLAKNFADPETRTKVLALVGGKAIGLTLLLSVMYIYLGNAALSLLTTLAAAVLFQPALMGRPRVLRDA